ncbi:hypothetical protein ACRALDRAFT_1093138 [Sodiomyces alcalophilus JCM 7366]|uniref:mitochondrial 37S ribosomal protein uS9m n=1 Tax=Sodiomyces alcalophilus JCM 7366 TaxID=591952 RepID=UPI0039B528DB
MSTLRHGLQKLGCLRQLAKPGLQQTQWLPRAPCRASTKGLTTSARKQQPQPETGPEDVTTGSLIAAPPKKPFEGVTHVRPMPVSPSYFSREPHFIDSIVRLNTLLHRYQNLPVVSPDQVPRQLWKTLEGYRVYSGEPVKALQYSQALSIVKRLHQIDPKLMPAEVKDALVDFKRDIDPFSNVPKAIPIDRFGRALGVGRRKTSTARAWVVEGTGEVQVNGKALSEAFGRIHDRESAVWALRSTQRMDKYNVWALVEGGGTTGQAEALTLAIAKGMLAHEPALKPILRQAGCITRDPRAVERKKHGHLKARKMPAWVKR